MVAISAYLGRDLFVSLSNSITKKTEVNGSKLIAEFAVVSDTHSDSVQTERALKQIKDLGLSYVIHAGDWTKVGTREELLAQKEIFDKSGLEYWGVMGDHDRWQSQEQNFESVLGRSYESFEKNGIEFILLDASDITSGLGDRQLAWLELLLKKSQGKRKVIFMHLPPYHPSSDRTIADKAGNDPARSQEVERFLNMINDQNVIAVFSGDHHLSSSYTEPKTSVRIFISGAVTSERNLQTPRWTKVSVYENSVIKVSDQVIN
jgi:predicted phosphodiesterase